MRSTRKTWKPWAGLDCIFNSLLYKGRFMLAKNSKPKSCALVIRALAMRALLALVVTVSIGAQAQTAAPLKIGVLYNTPIADLGWNFQHHSGIQAMEKAFGSKVKVEYVENVAEGPDAERVIRQLAQNGNQLIFTPSFGYMEPTLRVAKEFPKSCLPTAPAISRPTTWPATAPSFMKPVTCWA
jgi:ABC transporter substrate-binding protein PnrA-like